MLSSLRRLVAACAVMLLGAVIVLATGCLGQSTPPAKVVTKIHGHVRKIKIKRVNNNFALDDTATKTVMINSASTIFWQFKNYETSVDSAAIWFDKTPFDQGTHYVFTENDFGIDAGNVSVNQGSTVYSYRLLVYSKGKAIEVDPGVIIDDGRDSTHVEQ